MNSKKNKELEVDFIGGGEPLSTEEKQAISKYIAERKRQGNKVASGKRKKTLVQQKALAI